MSNFLKVAFVGTHGVGKTTMVEGLKRALHLGPNNVVEETATEVFELSKTDPSVRINQNSNMEGQLHIMGFQIKHENMKEDKLRGEESDAEEDKYKAVLLCDRAVTDAVVYTNLRTYRDDKYIWARNIASYLFKWVTDSISSPYDLVFYLPISFPLVSSDIRPGDTEFQETIDVAMQNLYIQRMLNGEDVSIAMKKAVRKTVVLSGSVERKLSIAKFYIDNELLGTKKAYNLMGTVPR